MRFRSWIVALVITLTISLLPLVRAECQVIFVSPCGMEIPQGTIGMLDVWVCLEGPIRDGINGAQFRISGLPAGWISNASPPPGVSVNGDPFGSGVTVSSSTCLTSSGQYLHLFTAAIFAPTVEIDVLLSATAIDPPLAPPFDCPFVYLCDPPTFSKVCCRGDGAWINVRSGPGCPLAVESKAWSEIKALYRDPAR